MTALSNPIHALPRNDVMAQVEAGAPPPALDSFTIRDLTREFGVTSRTLRFYEEKALLEPERRGLDRLYSRRDRARLKLVLMGKSVGFSLDEIKAMLDLYDVGDDQKTQLKVALSKFRSQVKVLQKRRDAIDAAIFELSKTCDTVERMLEGKTRTASP